MFVALIRRCWSIPKSVAGMGAGAGAGRPYALLIPGAQLALLCMHDTAMMPQKQGEIT